MDSVTRQNIILGGIILAVCLVIILILVFKKKENFFFEVSKCNPKCSGAFYGKPATFQFTNLSTSEQSCSKEECGYGMVCNCKYPECKQFSYGKGNYPQLNPGI